MLCWPELMGTISPFMLVPMPMLGTFRKSQSIQQTQYHDRDVRYEWMEGIHIQKSSEIPKHCKPKRYHPDTHVISASAVVCWPLNSQTENSSQDKFINKKCINVSGSLWFRINRRKTVFCSFQSLQYPNPKISPEEQANERGVTPPYSSSTELSVDFQLPSLHRQTT